MTLSLARHMPDSDVELFQRKHASAWRLLTNLIGYGKWRDIWRFTIVRSPWDIVRSIYVNIQMYAKLLEHDPTVRFGAAHEWVLLCRTLKAWDFERFVKEHWLRVRPLEGGYWRVFACDPQGGELGVSAIKFADVDAAWPEILERVNLPGWVERERVNSSAPNVQVEWTDELITLVGDRCETDIKKFGWEPPAIGLHVPTNQQQEQIHVGQAP